MRFVNSRTLGEYITEDNQLKCWGGTDSYVYTFVPEKKSAHLSNGDFKQNGIVTPVVANGKKVCGLENLCFHFYSTYSFHLCARTLCVFISNIFFNCIEVGSFLSTPDLT